MIRIRLYLSLLILQIALPASAFSNELPLTVKQKLLQIAIPESAIGVYVQEIGASQPLVAVNADAAMNPASHKWYYYIHDAKGDIHFAQTYDGHKENIDEYL